MKKRYKIKEVNKVKLKKYLTKKNNETTSRHAPSRRSK
tara:strand:+ start:10473 stop:10586 length:114 start_codon:yes stop_codon:yes gene_type:complete